ncbi:MAG: TIR domain-containing protein, partial [Pseudomonadota bacterium]
MRKGFISYSHSDKAICEALHRQLGPISRSLCSFWYDEKMKAGDEWNPTIEWHLKRCHVALVLLSPDSLRSDGFVVDIELPKLKRRARKGRTTLVPITARNSDFSEFEDLAERNIIPKGAAGGFIILGPDAPQGECDDWCSKVVADLRNLLQELPALDEHDEAVSKAIDAAKASLTKFEDSDAFDDLEGGLSNALEKQISGVKAALRAPRADFAFTLNAVTVSWQRNALAKIPAPDAAYALALKVYRALYALDREATRSEYDWPPEKERAELRAILEKNGAVEAVEAFHTQLDRVEMETNYTAQPGREPARQIAETVSDKAAIARAISDGDTVDTEGAAVTMEAANNIVDAARTELLASEGLEGGQQDIENMQKLMAEMSPTLEAGGTLMALTPPPPNDETREEWELEAAVAVLTGELIPSSRQPHLQRLSLSADDNGLFDALNSRGAALGEIYADPQAGPFQRRIALSDLTPLEGHSSLQTLSLDSTQVSDLTPLEGLSSLRMLSLNRTQVSDLTPLEGHSSLQTLSLDSTQVSDLTPLEGLS